jgi:glutathione-regulated potassium-efflux system protein KefB
MSVDTQGTDLVQLVALLGAAVIAVPISKRLGLGTVLGYLAAGLVIGPYGLKLFTDPQSILHVAELGVVMFLFIIGLEMQPVAAVEPARARSLASASRRSLPAARC